MDTATLVDERIDEGERFLDEHRKTGFDVAVAFWALTSEEGLWFLYIASPVVDTAGLAEAYRRVYTEFSRSQARWINRSDIKLIGSKSPIARDAIAYQSSSLPTRYGGRKLGNLIIEEAYIYPKPSGRSAP
jgi:hypothetical protein